MLTSNSKNFLVSDEFGRQSYEDLRKSSEDKPYKIVDIAKFAITDKIGRLAVAMSPGKQDTKWNRDLSADLSSIKENGIDVIVCLLEWSEMFKLGLASYPKIAQDSGFIFYQLGIPDLDAPSQKDMLALVQILVSHLVNGHNVLIHCRAGYGRAGTVSACCLTHFGYDANEAIEMVRKQRPGAIQTKKQENCIKNYYKMLKVSI